MNCVIREATAADSPGICKLFSKVFGAEMTEEEWAWKFERNPDGWFGIVAVAGGEVVGNYAGWAMRLLLEGRSTLVYSVGDVATDASVRALGAHRGVYRSMTEAFYEAVGARGVPFCFGFPNVRALQISHRIVGSRTLFPIRELRVPCDALPSPPLDVVTGDFVGESFNRLWSAASRYLTHAAVRDALRANWRFHARPTRYYRMVWRTQGGEDLSWAVLSVLGENAVVADFLGRESDGSDLLPLFSAAAAEARRLGAKNLVFWESPGGPSKGILGELPGERREAGFPLIVRVFDEDCVAGFAERVHLTPALYDVI